MTSGHDEHPLSRRGRELLRIVRDNYPDLDADSVVATSGQFNDVLILNGEIVVRFPRTSAASEALAVELAVLAGLQGRLPIPVPAPTLTAFAKEPQRPIFMGYRMLPGVPLDRDTLDMLWLSDQPAFEQMGRQAGEFLRALHSVPVGDVSIELPRADDRQFWSRMLDAFRDELFGYMRVDAREKVERRFVDFWRDQRDVAWQAVLRHGDFGGTNLLFEEESHRLTGVIDFGSVALGDPAVDLASISAFHPRLAQAMRPAYPELFSAKSHRRAAYYRSTFALQQALWALRAGDDDEFRDGIAAYV